MFESLEMASCAEYQESLPDVAEDGLAEDGLAEDGAPGSAPVAGADCGAAPGAGDLSSSSGASGAPVANLSSRWPDCWGTVVEAQMRGTVCLAR